MVRWYHLIITAFGFWLPTRCGIHPLQRYRKNDASIPTPWAKDFWSVFINEVEQLNTAIHYVERHPQKDGLSAQHHDFLAAVAI
jgi:hypothetical protein